MWVASGNSSTYIEVKFEIRRDGVKELVCFKHAVLHVMNGGDATCELDELMGDYCSICERENSK